MDIIKEIEQKMERLILPRRHAISPVLIYLGDVCDGVRDSGFFYRILDVGSFLDN